MLTSRCQSVSHLAADVTAFWSWVSVVCGDVVAVMSAVSSANWLHVVFSLVHACGRSIV